jgi:hypothetical protein
VPDNTIETVARAALAEVLPEGLPEGAVDLDAELDLLGLSSLNKVLFLTSVCDQLDVGLHHFTEHDLAGMRTLGHVVTALSRHAGVS